jgi:transposase InsO family protein
MRTSPTRAPARGWLYLAAVQDIYSRLIAGWSMATHMGGCLVVDALNMALARQRPDLGLIHHSNPGATCGPGSDSRSAAADSEYHEDAR